MNPGFVCLLSIVASNPAPAAEKWRIDFNGAPVVAPTRDLAVQKAQQLASVLVIGDLLSQPVLTKDAPTLEGRLAEERVDELLLRVNALAHFQKSGPPAASDSAVEALSLVRGKPIADATIQQLNLSLEEAETEVALDCLTNDKPYSDVTSGYLVDDANYLSNLEPLPSALRYHYLVFLDRLAGLRPWSQVPVASSKRDLHVQQEVSLPSMVVRMQTDSVKVQPTALKVSYRILIRDQARRTSISLIDTWTKHAGNWNYTDSTWATPVTETLGSAMKSRVLAAAKAEFLKIASRTERQKVEQQQRLAEKEERDRKEAERVAQEKRDQEQREAQERQKEQDRRNEISRLQSQLDDISRDIDRARSDRDQVDRDRWSARNEKSDADREADDRRRRKDDLEDKVRDAERKLDEAKREGKPTDALQSIVGELKGQLRGAEHDYDRAKDRVSECERRIRDADSRIDDLERRIRQLESDSNDVRNRISQLGG